MLRKRIIRSAIALCMTLIVIMEANTVLQGTKQGIQLCLYTVIPSLFPFIVLTCYLSSQLTGIGGRFLKPLSRFLGLPFGSEFLLILGLLGGYPVGAQGIYHAYSAGNISRRDAQRLLAFCNNAGPAFIFGMIGGCFSSRYTAWLIWVIHILSALITGRIFFKQPESTCICAKESTPFSFTVAVEKALRTIAVICGWVTLFRIGISLLEQHFPWKINSATACVLYGFVEITNGCAMLSYIPSEGLRFILASGLLSAGGLCVYLQTNAVTGDLHLKNYATGKITQTLISCSLSVATQYLIFPSSDRAPAQALIIILISALLVIPLFTLIFQKEDSISEVSVV